MSARDELAAVIADSAVPRDGAYVIVPAEAAAEVLAAGWHLPRIITSLNSLDALEVETIIRDADGFPKEKQTGPEGEYWAAPGHRRAFDPHEIWLPVTVLWEPQP